MAKQRNLRLQRIANGEPLDQIPKPEAIKIDLDKLIQKILAEPNDKNDLSSYAKKSQ